MSFENLRHFMDHLTSEYGIPGNAVRVYHDHELLYEYCSGYADLETKVPFTQSTIVNLYSCTKVITCAAAMSLFEKGKFLMSDPLHRYLPDFSKVLVKDKDSAGNEYLRKPKRDITIRDLFTMSAGFDYNLRSPSLLQAISNHPEGSALDIMPALALEPLFFDPGEHWQYSLCHDVLGAIIEKISDESLDEFFRKNIFDKCGMNCSGFIISDDVLAKMATQYIYDENSKSVKSTNKGNQFRLRNTFFSGGAGVYSTVSDYALFADAMACKGKAATGERILAEETVELMHSDCLSDNQKKDFNWTQYNGYSYGFGVRTMVDKTVNGSLSPLGEFGWGGAAGSLIIIDSTNKLSVCYTQHALNPPEPYIFPRLRNISYADASEFLK